MTPSVISPCINVCKRGAKTGFCLGCGRSDEEIALWRSETQEWRAALIDRLRERNERIGQPSWWPRYREKITKMLGPRGVSVRFGDDEGS